MTPGIKLTLTVVALLALGIAGFYHLASWSAPDHQQAAVFTGLLLTTFGVMAAKAVMTVVVMPLAIVRMGKRMAEGRKPMVLSARERDPLDRIGRVVFVAAFIALCTVVGAGFGWVGGGRGIFASAAAFAAFGALLAILVPADVVFATDVDTGGSITEEQSADHAAARQAGEPTILMADRVVERLRDTFVEDQRKP